MHRLAPLCFAVMANKKGGAAMRVAEGPDGVQNAPGIGRMIHIHLETKEALQGIKGHKGGIVLRQQGFEQCEVLQGHGEEHSVILTLLAGVVDNARTPDRRCRYTWRSEAPTSHCCCPRTTRLPSA